MSNTSQTKWFNDDDNKTACQSKRILKLSHWNCFFVMWKNIKRDRKFDPCNDFMQIYLIFKKFRSKSPYSVSISQLFSKKCHRNHPLKSHSRIDYAEIKLNNEKKNQNPFHSMTPATTPQTIVLESFFSTSRPLE